MAKYFTGILSLGQASLAHQVRFRETCLRGPLCDTRLLLGHLLLVVFTFVIWCALLPSGSLLAFQEEVGGEEQCAPVQPLPGGDPIDCEPAVVNEEECCDCGDSEHTTCPDPPDPPPPPRTPPPVCEGGGTGGSGGGECETEAFISGSRSVCNSPFSAATRSIVTTDASMNPADDGSCDPCSPRDPPCGSSGCDLPDPESPSCQLVFDVKRVLILANQTEVFGFGRAMASDFDMRMTIYPSTTEGHVGMLFDPMLGLLLYLVDDNEDGMYELEDNIYYESVSLVDSTGDPIDDPATASSEDVFVLVKRRNGFSYKLKVNPTTMSGGEYSSRLVERTNPRGQTITYTYKTFTQSEIDASPERQFILDEITDQFGNSASFDYHSTQSGGLWLIKTININEDEIVLDYEYTSSGQLLTVERNEELAASVSYDLDTENDVVKVSVVVAVCQEAETVVVSPDYETGDQTVVNQFANILKSRENGLGQVTSMIYHDEENPGWYKVFHQGTMAQVKLGQLVRYYVSYTNDDTGYDGITGTLESVYAQNPGITESQLRLRRPPQTTDATGYTVDNTYDSNGNLIQIEHPDSSYEKWIYNSNNRVIYYRDRAGFVTTTQYDTDNNPLRIVRGLSDPSGSGSPTATDEAVQELFGYYETSHANEGMLAWRGTTPYSGSTFTPPAANSRTDFQYNSNQRLVKVIQPLPEGQSTRPEIQYTWISNRKASETNQLNHTTTFSYDVFGRLIETLYSDGTTTQTYYDDVNFKVYQKNRVGVVSKREYGPSRRLIYQQQSYSVASDISGGSFGTLNPADQRQATTYAYVSGTTRPSSIHRQGSQTLYTYDFRGRTLRERQFPRIGPASSDWIEIRSQHHYVDNQRVYIARRLFYNSGTIQNETRTYFGYSADRLTVRTIQTRKESVTFGNNTAILNATRDTGADPNYIINDAVRDVRGNIVQLIDPMGIESLTTYDALGRSLVQSRTKGSLTLASESVYDHLGNVVETTSETGLVSEMEYDPAGNLKTRTVGVGTSSPLVWSYTYAPDGRQLTETAPGSAVTTSVVQSCCGFSSGTKNALGHGTIVNRNSAGQTVHTATVEDFDSHTNLLNPIDGKTLSETTSKYGLDGHLQFQTVWKSPLGAIDRNDPPIAGINSIPVADGVTTQYVRLLTTTPQRTINRLGGGTAEVSITEALDQLVETPANGGAGISFNSTRVGTANLVISPDEKTMQLSLADGIGRNVMSATLHGPASSTPNELIHWSCTRYDDIDTTVAGFKTMKTTQTDPDGNTVQSFTDGYGRTVVSLDQLDKESSQVYNAGGNLLKSINALSQETVYTYDDLGRQLTVKDPLNNTQSTAYSTTTGQVTSRTDAKSNTTTFTYDEFGRQTVITDRTGKETTNAYDSAGRLASVTDAESRVTNYTYNALGQRTVVTLPNATAKTYEYDPAGRMVKTTNHSGISQTTIYEFSGVVDKIEYRDSGNTLVGSDDYTYDTLLRRTAASGRYGTTQSWTYDDLGRMIGESLTYSSQTYPVSYDYDSRGRLVEITYPSGRKAAYSFDVRNQLDEIDWDGSQIEDRSYDDLGRLTGVDRPGVDETRTYDAAGRLTAINNTNVGDATYTYDANHNKLSESWSGAMAAWNFVTTHVGANPDGYDAEDRFVHFAQSAQSKTFNFTRSDIGNINNINLNGTGTARTFNNIHALTQIGSDNQTFDVDGNLTLSHAGHTLAWDEAGMMKESVVPNGSPFGIEGTTEYGYDADRKRVWKKHTPPPGGPKAETSVYVYAGPNCIAEYPAGTAAASPTQEYVYAQEIDSLVLLVKGGGTDKYTITRNQQWSVTALAELASGTIVERYTYDHFGKRTILEPNETTVRSTSSYAMPYGYTSRRHDAETDLMYFRARYYDTHTAEFLSPDPLEYVDGMSLFRGYFAPGQVDPFGSLSLSLRGTAGCSRKVGVDCHGRTIVQIHCDDSFGTYAGMGFQVGDCFAYDPKNETRVKVACPDGTPIICDTDRPAPPGCVYAGAVLVCGVISADACVPEPTDVCVPKWVCYAIAGGIAICIIKGCGGPRKPVCFCPPTMRGSLGLTDACFLTDMDSLSCRCVYRCVESGTVSSPGYWL